VLGIKKLILFFISLHSFLACMIAILVLSFVLVWEFRKRKKHLVCNLDSPSEPSIMPGIWTLVAIVMPKIRDIKLPDGTYKIGKVCLN
jgi:hypothetical protein